MVLRYMGFSWFYTSCYYSWRYAYLFVFFELLGLFSTITCFTWWSRRRTINRNSLPIRQCLFISVFQSHLIPSIRWIFILISFHFRFSRESSCSCKMINTAYIIWIKSWGCTLRGDCLNLIIFLRIFFHMSLAHNKCLKSLPC